MNSAAQGSLIGGELSGVGFIRDYVELYFDGPVLRLLGNLHLESPSSGSEQSLERKLVALIGSTVNAVREFSNAIEIAFSGGAAVCCGALSGLPEYAHFIAPGRPMVVWQPQ